jgi:SAM-dependent methyltransferase
MDAETVRRVAVAVLTVVAVVMVLNQCRKPAWWPGRLFLGIMNLSHVGVTKWGLTHVELEKRFTILDVGCGGGRTVKTLAATASEGKVYGVDYSAASVAASRKTNALLIGEGRV